MNFRRDRLPELLIILSCPLIFGNYFGCGCDRKDAPLRETPGQLRINQPLGKLPLAFELNAGQADPRYQLLAHGAGHDLYLSAAGVSLALRDGLGVGAGAIEMTLADAKTDAGWEPIGASAAGRMNYFIGSDPSRWITNIPTFSRVRYRSVYPGIDVDYYGNRESLEHDFIVAPGGDPSKIRMRFTGATSRRIDADGSLAIERDGRVVRWQKPVIYQETAAGVRQEVQGAYRLSGDEAGFSLGQFDRRRPLVIDPVVSYSTFLGRNANEGIFSVAVDGSGNTYLAGTTSSPDYATTPGSPATAATGAGAGDVIVTKLNAAGTAMIYSARIGGVGRDVAMGIA